MRFLRGPEAAGERGLVVLQHGGVEQVDAREVAERRALGHIERGLGLHPGDEALEAGLRAPDEAARVEAEAELGLHADRRAEVVAGDEGERVRALVGRRLGLELVDLRHAVAVGVHPDVVAELGADEHVGLLRHGGALGERLVGGADFERAPERRRADVALEREALIGEAALVYKASVKRRVR